MKKWISVLLVLIITVQLLPTGGAFASAGDVLTDAELGEALALAGLEVRTARGEALTPRGGMDKASLGAALAGGADLQARGDSGYHAGMEPDDAWDAQMIIDMIETDVALRFYHISDTFARAEVLLERMKTEDPAEYARLVTDHQSGDDLLDMAVSEGQSGGEIHRELLSLKERLEEDVVMIEQMSIGITQDREQLMDHEVVRWSEKIREAMEDIKAIRTEVIVMYLVLITWVEEMESAVNGTYHGSFERLTLAHDWLREIFAWEEGPQEAVSPVVTARGGITLMSRLGAGTGVLNAADRHDATLTVIAENQVCIRVYGEKDVPLKGITVRTQDCGTENAPVITSVTDDGGRVIISAEDFYADFEKEITLRVWVDASSLGYKDFYVPNCRIYRGGLATYYTTKLGSTQEPEANGLRARGNGEAAPYIYSADFKGYDIVHQNFDMLFSAVNDMEFDITVTVKNPSGGAYAEPKLHYFEASDTPRERMASPVSRNVTDAGDVYVFRGQWKRLFLPEAKSKPWFTLGDEVISTLLTPVRTETDQPTVIGDEPGSPLSNLLAEGFGFTFTIPMGEDGIKADVKLPISKDWYWPKIVMLPNGFTVSMGSDATNPNMPINKKNAELENYDKEMKKYENQTFTARKMAELGDSYKYYKSSKVRFFAKSSLKFGWFVMASAKWDTTEGTLVTVGGATGLTVNYTYDWLYPTTISGIPVYINYSFSLTGGACFQFQVEMMFRDGSLSSIKFYPMKAITIDFRFTVSLTLGVGIKGLLSAWVKGTFMLNLILSFYTDRPSHYTAFWQANVSVGVELLFLSFSHVILKKPKEKLLDYTAGDTKRASLFDILMGTALADEAAESVPVVGQTPEKYPALRPDLTKILDPSKNSSNDQAQTYDIRTVRYRGYTYAFYIKSRMGSDLKYHKRLGWVCLEDPSKTGTFYENLRKLSDKNLWDLTNYDDSSFDVYTDGSYIYVVCVTYGEYDANGDPERNDLHLHFDVFPQMVYVAVMGMYPDKNLGVNACKADRARYYGSNYADVSYDSVADPRITYARRESGFYEIRAGLSQYPYNGGSERTGVTFLDWKSGSDIIFRTDRLVGSGMGAGYGRIKVIPLMGSIQEHDTPFEVKMNSDGFIALSAPTGGKEGDTAIEMFDVAMNVVQFTYWDQTTFRYYTETKTNYNKVPIVLERGDIRDITVVQYPNVTKTTWGSITDYNKPYIDVFYAPWESRTVKDEETGESYEVGSYRLKSLHIEPRTNADNMGTSYTIPVTKFEYDVSLPTPYIDSITFGGMSYLYWTTIVTDPEDEDKTLYRIDCVAFDPARNTMSDVMTLAEIEIPNVALMNSGAGGTRKGTVADVDLTEEGVAYVCVKPVLNEGEDDGGHPVPTLFSFPTTLKPVLDFTGMMLSDDTVTQGQFLGVNYTLMNEGNMGVSSFDMELYRLDGSGKEGKAVEILHANLLDISKSTLVDAATGRVLASGTAVLSRLEDYVYGGKQRDWVTGYERMTFRVDNGAPPKAGTVDESQTQYICTDVIVPGAMAALNSTILIPSTWSGKMTLRLRLTHVSAYSNWTGVMAAVANAKAAQRDALLANGVPAVTARGGDDPMAALHSVMGGGLDVDSIIAGVEGAHRLEYDYDDASGKLVLQKLVSRDGEAVDYSLYAEEIDAPQEERTLTIEENDIEVGHRLYYNAEGEYMLDISLINYIAHQGTGMRMTCAVYLDGSDEPIYVNLPYDADQLAHGRTQTITFKVADILDPEACRKARFVFRGIGFEETAYSNNEFTLYFNNSDALRFMVQPGNTVAAAGKDAVFTVAVTGGTGKYTFVWQYFNNDAWWTIEGADGPALTLEKVRKDMDGRRVRCVVTDEAGSKIISDEAVLTVSSPAQTGDTGMVYVYALIAPAALLLMALLRRRKRKTA